MATKKSRKSEADKQRKKQIKQLISLGSDQGFVTQEQILEIFVLPERFVDELDDLYDHLFSKGVDVFESVVDDAGGIIEGEQTELEKEASEPAMAE